MTHYNDPAHLPRPVLGPTREDIDRHSDEAYERERQRQVDEESDDE